MRNSSEITLEYFVRPYSEKDEGMIVFTDSMGIADSQDSRNLVSKGHTSCVAMLIFNTSNGERALIHINKNDGLEKLVDVFFENSKGDLEVGFVRNVNIGGLPFTTGSIVDRLKTEYKESATILPDIEIRGFFKVKFSQDGAIHIGDEKSDNNYHSKIDVFHTENVIRCRDSLKRKIETYLKQKQSLNKPDENPDQEEGVLFFRT